MSSNIEVTRVCECCGNDFTARTTVTKYCSHKCASRAYKLRTRDAKVTASTERTRQTITRPIEQLKAKEYLSLAEACLLIGVSRRTLYRLIERNQLKAGRFGTRRIVRRSDIDRYFEDTTDAEKGRITNSGRK